MFATVPENPFPSLLRRLHRLGRILNILCVAWIAVVGASLLWEMTPEDVENHRAKIIKTRLTYCSDDSFSRRFDCASAILLDGGRNGALDVLARLGLTVAFPALAWGVWGRIMRRTRDLGAQDLGTRDLARSLEE